MMRQCQACHCMVDLKKLEEEGLVWDGLCWDCELEEVCFEQYPDHEFEPGNDA